MGVNERNREALKGLIEIYDNDFMCGYEGDDFEELRVKFLELIRAMTRYVLEYRYCSRDNCQCSPKSDVRNAMKWGGREVVDKFVTHGVLTENSPGLIRAVIAETEAI